jgi:hypothetical protein
MEWQAGKSVLTVVFLRAECCKKTIKHLSQAKDRPVRHLEWVAFIEVPLQL